MPMFAKLVDPRRYRGCWYHFVPSNPSYYETWRLGPFLVARRAPQETD